MLTLIVPCGGKSSRFPGLKPKWMLTHPDGMLMVQKSILGLLRNNKFDRIIVTILKQHEIDYDAIEVLKRALCDIKPEVELCVLSSPTKSQSETVFKTIKQMNVSGSFVIKDSDNYVEIGLDSLNKNVVGSVSLAQEKGITNVASKSFLIANDQDIIQRIVEKDVVSNDICVGVYGFSDAQLFVQTYLELDKLTCRGELYISHVIARLISSGQVFQKLIASSYVDWGTINEWHIEQCKFRTIFIDFDGVLIKNSGKYGKLNWDNNELLNEKNCQLIRELQQRGSQIVITTARPWSYEKLVRALLERVGIEPYFVLMGLNHAQRVIVNDFAPTNPYPSCISISIPRDGDLSQYLS